MITPILVPDSRERWRPIAVESLLEVGTRTDAGEPLKALDQLDSTVARIDFPPNMTQPDAPAVGYYRMAPGGGLIWHQFWCWYLYNPKKYAGFGAHEGDWEMFQLGCTDEAGDHPILATCSQHASGERREFWRVELEGTRPILYVARDSHAGYFSTHQDVSDQADGAGEMLDVIDWRPFGEWADWPGKWGNSDNSPGPLTTRRAWQAPHAWHSQARG